MCMGVPCDGSTGDGFWRFPEVKCVLSASIVNNSGGITNCVVAL